MGMTFRERLLATVRFESLDRPFRLETLGFWRETLERWRGEGLPAEVDNELSAFIHFGCDLQVPLLLGADQHPGLYPLFEEEIIQQDERYITKRDITGSLVRVPADGSSTIPQIIEAPVKDEESWEEIKHRLDPSTPGRLESWKPFIQLANEQPWPLCVYITGLFGTHRHLLGFQELMLAYRRRPQLLHLISRHWVGMWKGILGAIHEIRPPDMVTLWEDMCYRNGPMIGPRAFQEFMSPYYRELVGFLRKELDIPIVAVDTDGKMELLIPLFLEAGVNLIWPFEVQAEMDVVKIGERWPREFAIWGGMDKRVLARDRKGIEEEVMRVMPPLLKRGGYIPAIDHAVPPDVPLENWLFFLELVRNFGEDFYKR